MKLPKALKKTTILSFSLLYGAGTVYWLSRLFLKHQGEFGEEPHFLERIAGPVHVVAAFFFLFVVGMVWSDHVAIALKLKKPRMSGWVFFALMAFLIGTGVAILYGGENLMKSAEWVHPWIGQLLLATILFHWFFRKARH